MSRQVFDGPNYCTCRVARIGGGDVEIVTDGCAIHSPNVPADALASALPLKTEVAKWREWEDAAEAMLTPREILRVIALDTPEVRDLYGRRYGKQARG